MKRGVFASILAIAANLLLAAAKLTVGAVFGLVSVIADGFNNVSDCGSGILSLISFRISAKPADSEHPYGHRRAEYIAALGAGAFVLFLAVETLRESIEKLVSGGAAERTWVVFAVLAASVAVKAGMYIFFRIEGKKLSSDVLRATATDSLCDCAATIAVIAGLAIMQFTSFPVDGIFGILVALFIIWQGVKILQKASSQLLGQAPDAALVEGIRAEILSRKEVLGMHDLHVFSYGSGALFATVHIEMDATMSAIEAHEIIDGIEHAVKEKHGTSLTAHLDPVDLQDGEALSLGEKILSRSKELFDGLNIHDLRLVRGIKPKVIFDADVPFSCPLKDGEIAEKLKEIVEEAGDYVPVITVERR